MDPKTTQKPTGLNTITSTLNRGSTGDQVKALQQYLIGMGYNNVKADGVFGPITESAVKQFQLDNNLSADGHFGPQTLGTAKTIGATSTTAGNPGSVVVPKTQAELDALYNKAVVSHPTFAGNTPEALANAQSTGDFSGLYNEYGQPFSSTDQAQAVSDATAALAPGYEATKQYETQNTEDVLKQKNADYQSWLDSQKTNFQTDKTNLDQNAADQGVLFSGGRIQKQQALGDTYAKNNAAKLGSVGTDIIGTARDYQYKYGNDAGNNLSQYYNLGSNVYNPNVATGGATSGGLSSIYNPSTSNFQGTANVANKTAIQTRAAGLLANKGNKLLSTGYKNQF